ncbi:flagellar basal body P-ring formation protein FlgA [Helicobacter saguini]|uniref:Flagella basal body P-ring formation protein FlgA n=1 Tax=Helicobacter saguini TaxID=1548018 RepID=A0A347VSQ7_9HELI|nr:flagellar basal body P-ring formation chaperone FlgA [Helicobacter saguini]MWV62404.1 flagellar basal body P-ring formation protein FlgA [Helicobacter saguini]MWV66924.1 flagellar basal body P-ring formation protein FlgA [Helicobacter saguini]MWV69272.1 flagellar basal body P-ring formation protein FlgA [Helicobacter saguini]MWV71172.1 flagellar basal body P-ring formation protein FlgA [Helicobacter saguini]TLD94941.1 flagellar basal body P-ring formation protein FlgA [Helicobacter saguini]
MKKIFVLLFVCLSALSADNVEVLKSYIAKEYKATYPEIIIESISLITRNTLDLHAIDIIAKSITSPKNANGYMNLSYKINNKTMQENIKYSIKAKIKVFYATDNIAPKSNFRPVNFNEKIQDFNIFTNPPASRAELLQSSAKVYIPINSMITQNKITRKILVPKDSNVKVVFKSGGIEAIFSAKALENGMKGDIIKIENNESKRVINAEVIDENTVRIKD